MSKAIEELLVSVADECESRTGGISGSEDVEIIAKVLRERLGPLLEAGQAMRKSRINISDDAMAWDAALAAGKGQA